MTVDTISPSQRALLLLASVKMQKGKNLHPIFKSLRPHTEISSEFEQLKFHAAASWQLQLSQDDDEFSAKEFVPDTRLVASPYNSVPHLLDLDTLDTQSRLLALSLSLFTPVRSDYATGDYLEFFNWPEVFQFLKALAKAGGHAWKKQSFYVVSFRSQLQPGVDNDHLHALDAYSHQEAVSSGGLLKYWFGTKNKDRRNLATCIWRNRDDARLGGRGPWHAKARAAARTMYESIAFSTLELVIGDHVDTWDIREWRNDHP
ncbi:hypothetical protein N7539_004204 [Penicillium diatomitis]|uniref:Uncharacterized protein n=1 Tax=Penicillium diatomitis TaxID=2819901 RepID=A0A9X0BY99_9EURO|nr:uncharacterized protein N7539_004204 [Penicillium diatomitis]KAJ5489314.1 hypothetical protein N7539_004204 [Penicillium diatomitis]